MKSIFDKVSNDCSRLVIKRYSTSFYFSSNLLSKTIRQDIFNIYGFVRLADEIVDTFHGYPKKELRRIHLKMHRKKRISHFFQTMIYDPFYDDLCVVSIRVHALNTYD